MKIPLRNSALAYLTSLRRESIHDSSASIQRLLFKPCCYLGQKVAALLPSQSSEVCNQPGQQQDLGSGIFRMSQHPPPQVFIRIQEEILHTEGAH